MHWNLSLAILLAGLLAAMPGAEAQELGLEADLDLVVEMPLAVADAFDAGVPVDALALLAGSLVDGEVSPADFIEVVTLAPLAYEVVPVEVSEVDDRDLGVRHAGDPRRVSEGPGIGAYVQRQLDRGLRGRELSRAIHRELQRRGIPAGNPGRRVGVRGGDRVAIDLNELRELRDRRVAGEGDRVPPGRWKQGDEGRGRTVPPGHAKERGRGRDEDRGKGHGPPPHAGARGKGNGGGR